MDNNENIYSADFLRNIKYASRGEVPVRLKLTSRHVIPDMRVFGTTMGMPSADLSLFEEEEEGIDMLDRLLEEESEELLEEELLEEGTQPKMPTEESDTYTFCTTAGMKTECGVVTITYEENTGCTSEIIFDTGKPEMVTIHRTGGIMNTLVLEKGKRHISVYNTPVMPFETAVLAKKVDVNMTYEDGGDIALDYLVELRGMDLQRTEMKIHVERM
ncbi:MAG: DUF1934 domain-containing protein [Eubacteriales bacterium]|nr:DUF1934 domain-containing protein [Eubacteriales bacterium]